MPHTAATTHLDPHANADVRPVRGDDSGRWRSRPTESVTRRSSGLRHRPRKSRPLTALIRRRTRGGWRQTGSGRRRDPASAAATNRLAALMTDVIELTDVPERFERWLAGRPLAQRSRREYARNVRAYCAWLAVTPDRDGWHGDPLSEALARDHAARDYRRYLQVERRAAPSTVNLALASLDALYRCLGLGRPNVRREKPAQAASRALDEDAQRRKLRAAGPRTGAGDAAAVYRATPYRRAEWADCPGRRHRSRAPAAGAHRPSVEIDASHASARHRRDRCRACLAHPSA